MDGHHRGPLFPLPLSGEGPVLQQVCTATRALLDVTAVAAAVMSQGSGGGAVAWSGPGAVEVFDSQFDLGEGPARDAFATRAEVLVDDLCLTGSGRWPAFTDAATGHGVAAVFVLPSGLGAIEIGVLQLHRDRPGPLTPAQLADARLVAQLCSVLLIDRQAGIDDGNVLSASWPSRTVVHQATGMLSVQLGTPLAAALARLRAYAFSQDRPLEDVAHDVVDRRLRLEP